MKRFKDNADSRDLTTFRGPVRAISSMLHTTASRGSAGNDAGFGNGRELDPMTSDEGLQGTGIDPFGAGRATRRRPSGCLQDALVNPGPDVGLAS